jgi:23S rRNA pseudouridine2605 synthase
MSERLHKVLAQHGVGSRREVERWIVEGRIQINGVIAKTGDRYVQGDRVQLDGREVGKRLDHAVPAQVIAYHKPQGQPIERSNAARSAEHAPEVVEESVEERLPVQRGSRWVAINPMHPGDSGLLLFTNDGALSYALTRQKKKISTIYMVRVHVRGGIAAAPELPVTIRMDDGVVDFTEVSVTSGAPEGDSEAGNIWYKVVMARADKRAAVRALFVSHNLTVSRMMQVSFGNITLTKEMPRARHLPLKTDQVESLYALAQLKMPVNEARQQGMQRSGHVARAVAATEVSQPRSFTALEARAATRARGGSRSTSKQPESAAEPAARGPQQRTALRRGMGGGSNRPSRPGPRKPG